MKEVVINDLLKLTMKPYSPTLNIYGLSTSSFKSALYFPRKRNLSHFKLSPFPTNQERGIKNDVVANFTKHGVKMA